MPRIIAVIPAKTQSNRVQNKNLRDLCGKPLYRYALDNCVAANVFEKIYLSSDGILDTDLKATLHNRQMPLCGDVPASEVAREVVRDMYADVLTIPEWTCLVQPTSPCLRSSTLAAAAGLCAEDVDAVIAHAPEALGAPCGAFYFVRTYMLLHMVCFADVLRNAETAGRMVWYPIASSEAVDVDCHWHLDLVEMILRGRGHA